MHGVGAIPLPWRGEVKAPPAALCVGSSTHAALHPHPSLSRTPPSCRLTASAQTVSSAHGLPEQVNKKCEPLPRL
jgi:hypothetical protein